MKLHYLLIVLIFLLPVVVAQSPFQTSSVDGLTIVTPLFEKVPLLTNRTIYWEVYNSSTDIEMTNRTVNCTFILYYYGDGSQVHKRNATFSSDVFYVYLDGKNFSKPGIYSKHISCYSGSAGGFSEFSFIAEMVPLTGNEVVVGILLSVIVLLPLLFGFLIYSGAKLINEEATVMRTGLFLTALPLFFASGWLSLIVLNNYYPFIEFSNAMAIITQIVSYIFYALVVLFFIMLIFSVVRTLMGYKKEKEEAV